MHTGLRGRKGRRALNTRQARQPQELNIRSEQRACHRRRLLFFIHVRNRLLLLLMYITRAYVASKMFLSCSSCNRLFVVDVYKLNPRLPYHSVLSVYLSLSLSLSLSLFTLSHSLTPSLKSKISLSHELANSSKYSSLQID
jgi:hypothetical protein